MQPWTETIISVSEFEPATRLFRIAGDWQLRLSGPVESGEIGYWRLPPDASPRFELWCAPGAVTGCIRFVQFTGVEQEPIRVAARAWDTGGIYSLMVRSNDIPGLFQKAIELGWWAESRPIRFQFGTSDLRNVVLQGPHGINVAVYERISPAFTEFPVGRISQGFNSMRMVRKKPVARAFYEDVLGFGVLFDNGREPEKPARSNFGIPFNYTPAIERSATALQPSLPGETGRVEVMQIEGFEGDDLSGRALPPNLGILSVRYPVSDLASYRAVIEARGAEIVHEARGVAIAGIGNVDISAVRDPDGNLTEFFRRCGKAGTIAGGLRYPNLAKVSRARIRQGRCSPACRRPGCCLRRFACSLRHDRLTTHRGIRLDPLPDPVSDHHFRRYCQPARPFFGSLADRHGHRPLPGHEGHRFFLQSRFGHYNLVDSLLMAQHAEGQYFRRRAVIRKQRVTLHFV